MHSKWSTSQDSNSRPAAWGHGLVCGSNQPSTVAQDSETSLHFTIFFCHTHVDIISKSFPTLGVPVFWCWSPLLGRWWRHLLRLTSSGWWSSRRCLDPCRDQGQRNLTHLSCHSRFIRKYTFISKSTEPTARTCFQRTISYNGCLLFQLCYSVTERIQHEQPHLALLLLHFLQDCQQTHRGAFSFRQTSCTFGVILIQMYTFSSIMRSIETQEEAGIASPAPSCYWLVNISVSKPCLVDLTRRGCSSLLIGQCVIFKVWSCYVTCVS